MHKNFKILLLIISVIFLGACGGGGGAPSIVVAPPLIVVDALHKNYAKIGYYNDQLSQSASDQLFHDWIDRFASTGYTGVIFELTVSVDNNGTLLHNLTYDRMYQFIDYAKSKGLATGILYNWTFNDDNAAYIAQIAYHQNNPVGFTTVQLLDSVDQFFQAESIKFKQHNVDIVWVADDMPEQFADAYVANWTTILNHIRSVYTGKISTFAQSSDIYNGSTIDWYKTWSLMDAVSIRAKPFVSDTPIYDVNTVVSKLFYDPVHNNRFVDEVKQAKVTYGKPIVMMIDAFAIDGAMNGGWDPTNSDSVAYPASFNTRARAIMYDAYLRLVSNSLQGVVTSIVVGNYEPWSTYTFSDPMLSSFKYFSLTLFPDDVTVLLREYFSDPAHYRLLVGQTYPLQ